MQITFDPSDEADVALVRFVLSAGDEPAAAAPAPRAAKKAAAAKPEPAEDLLGGDSPTVADAVALGTKLVSEGESAKVKSALAEVGSKKVSEVPEDKVTEFIALLEA